MVESLMSLHFMRPMFLWLLLPALVLFVALLKRQRDTGNWSRVIDPHLLAYLTGDMAAVASNQATQGSATDRKRVSQKLRRFMRPRGALIGLFAAWFIAVIALAGPAWRQMPQPLHQQEDVLVVVLDLSLSMFAEDATPSRIVQARRKIEDVLTQRQTGLTALVVYSGGAHVVSPLTDDVNTILALLPTLDPSIMPSYGSRFSEALALAQTLLTNSGARQGRLLLLSDGVSDAEITKAVGQNATFDVGVIGVGSALAVPIPLPDGRLLVDKQRQTVRVARETQQLKRLANRLGGRYHDITLDNTDISNVWSTNADTPEASIETQKTYDQWRSESHWLVWLLIPVLLLAFRKGMVLSVALCVMMSWPEPSYALSASDIWQGLWRNADQQGAAHYEQGAFDEAAQVFDSKAWQSAAHYKRGDYEAALAYYEQMDESQMQADDFYNRGNIQAQLGQYDEAIASYDAALSYLPTMKDAIHNKQLLEQMQQSSENSQGDGESGDSDQQSSGEQQEGDQNNNQSGDQNGDQSSDQNGDQSSQQQSGAEGAQSDSQNQNGEEQPDVQQQLDEQQENQAAADSQRAEQTPKDAAAGDSASVTQAPSEMSEAEETQSDETNPSAYEQGAQSQEALKTEEQQALEQWLRRVPDDPAGLLRNKFRYQYQQERQQGKPTVQQDDEVFW